MRPGWPVRGAVWRSVPGHVRIGRAPLPPPRPFPSFPTMPSTPVRPIRPLVSLLALLGVGWVALRPVGPLPPLGPLLDPANGIWASVRSAELPLQAEGAIPGLEGPVEVVYDDRDVPHIFATTTQDAYRALGYVVARDRLFQIEMQTRAGGGTLTELVGAAALPLDRATRALGMPRAAEARLAAADTTTPTLRMATAYAQGVNAWIDGLSPRDLPFEYILLGKRPARYGPLQMVHLMHRMGYTLASSEDELQHLAATARVGREAADALFPVHAPIVEPIQPNGGSAPRRDVAVLPPPGEGDPVAAALLETLGGPEGRLALGLPARQPDAVGSNNWAVSPSRTASRNALLAGDPHLELTLPSIWYEVHLVVPDSMDVYGVTIPGLPGVVIGFNRDVAWTFTNVGADVMDYYLEAVDDPDAPTRYRLDGAWEALDLREERYLDPAGTVVAVDTLRSTHRGPLRRVGDRWISQRWTVLEGEIREPGVFHQAGQATTTGELLDQMAQRFMAPAQNMLAADREGTIGIRSTGRYPIRPGDGAGNVLGDGTTRGSDWTGNWAVAEYPQSVSPAQGFLASANQQPMDPMDEPRYMGANWERPWRALRINTLLRRNDVVTAEDMRAYQTDPGSARAELFVPAFLEAVAATTGSAPGSNPVAVPDPQGAPAAPPGGPAASPSLQAAAALLADWDRSYRLDREGTLLFETAMAGLARLLWDEFLEEGLGVERALPSPLPSDMMTAILLYDPTSPWWDLGETSAVETRDAILTRALEEAWDTLVSTHGTPEGRSWHWGEHRTAAIHHLLRIPSLGRLGIPMQGGTGTLNPSSGSGTHGASWRMVVELGDQVTARAIYPGGQSGHPASRRYDDRLANWAAGRLDSLRVPRSGQELPDPQRRGRLLLAPGDR